MAKRAKKVSKKVIKSNSRGKRRRIFFVCSVLIGAILDVYSNDFPVYSLSGLGFGLIILGLASLMQK
jgi:hypothetical protein